MLVAEEVGEAAQRAAEQAKLRAAERADGNAAERMAKAESAIRYGLSDEEKEIVRRLNERHQTQLDKTMQA